MLAATVTIVSAVATQPAVASPSVRATAKPKGDTAHAYSSWATARLVAAVVVVVALIVIWVLAKFAGRVGSGSGGILNGVDNRWSTSKVSMALWTVAVLWAFVTILVRYRGTAVPHTVPAAYFALLGIPAAAAVGAQAITKQNAAAKTTLDSPTNNPFTGLAQVFSDDSGAPDLLDSQYFLFNLVLLAFFVASFFHIPSPTGSDIQLPALPGALLALAGVSGAAYLGKKAVTAGPAG
jgi:hypothetical protein